MRCLNTFDEVIEAIGPETVQKVANVKRTAVANWRKRGKLPRHTYLLFQPILRRKRLTAPASLWGLMEPPKQAAE
jgi:hypothetical protein